MIEQLRKDLSDLKQEYIHKRDNFAFAQLKSLCEKYQLKKIYVSLDFNDDVEGVGYFGWTAMLEDGTAYLKPVPSEEAINNPLTEDLEDEYLDAEVYETWIPEDTNDSVVIEYDLEKNSIRIVHELSW